MRSTLKTLLTVLGLTDAMAVCLLDSYGLIGNVAMATAFITTAIGMPLLIYYMNRYHKKGCHKKNHRRKSYYRNGYRKKGF
jgi:hypothetical protein